MLVSTHPSNVAPVWSPDGKQILFLSNRSGKCEFFVYQFWKNVTDQIPLNYSCNSDRIV